MPLKIKHSLHAKIFYIQTITISLIALCLIVGISYAWNAPTQSPPNGNVDTPLNTGAITQTKSGGLNINGNVGIGTINPKAKLDVEGSKVKFEGFTTGGNILFSNAGSIGSGIYFNGPRSYIVNNGGSNELLQLSANNGSGGGAIIFNTAGHNGQMIVNSVGNVGIGTTNPKAKLDVEGGVLFGLNNGVYTSPVANVLSGDGSNTRLNADSFHTNGLGAGQIFIEGSSIDANTSIVIGAGRAGGQIARNVGIGTAWPSQKLTVNGNVSANDYWINSIGKWASSLGGGGYRTYASGWYWGGGGLAIKYCPIGETMVSGGCQAVDYCSGNDWSAYGGFPYGNGWACQRWGCNATRVYVRCVK